MNMVAPNKLMRIRIVGGGMAGLASAQHLLKTGKVKSVEIFDSNAKPGVGKLTASSCSIIMHPFSPRGTIIWKGLEGYDEALDLLQSASSASNGDGIFEDKQNIIRPCFSARAVSDWGKAVDRHANWFDVMTKEQVISSIGGGEGPQRVLGGVIYKNAVIVDAPKYLFGLWKSVEALSTQLGASATWIHREQVDVQSLLDDDCDALVLANGAGCNALWKSVAQGTEDLPFMYVRGQTVTISAPIDALSSLAAVLSAEFPGYVVPLNGQLVCGATHEYGTLSELLKPPDMDEAILRLRGKLDVLCPYLLPWWEQAQYATAGIRVSTQRSHLGRLPVIGRHGQNNKVWLMSGFGSKGLIYHGLFARHLAAAVVNGRPVPTNMRL